MIQFIGGAIAGSVPGFIVGAWYARVLRDREDWVANKAKHYASRAAFFRRLFSPIGYTLAGLLLLAALAFIAGGKQ